MHKGNRKKIPDIGKWGEDGEDGEDGGGGGTPDDACVRKSYTVILA